MRSPVSDKDLAAFNEARAKYQDKVKFFMIDPVANETRESVQQELDKHGLDIPVLMDETQLVAEGLGVNKVGEVFLMHPGTTEVLYRGPANKYFVTRDRRRARRPSRSRRRRSGRAAPPSNTSPRPIAANASRTITYSKDVAPILADNCARCHREGGIAPFAMNSHAIVKGFAPMIREVVLTKRMPPGQIDPHVGDFKETFTLTRARAADADPLDRSGRRQGRRRRSADAAASGRRPSGRTASRTWSSRFRAQEVPATGVLDYIRYIKCRSKAWTATAGCARASTSPATAPCCITR